MAGGGRADGRAEGGAAATTGGALGTGRGGGGATANGATVTGAGGGGAGRADGAAVSTASARVAVTTDATGAIDADWAADAGAMRPM